MNQNNKLQLSILIITLVAVIIIGCDSNNDASQEPIEPEEVVEPKLEEVIEDEAEPEEIADGEPEEVIEEDPEIKAVVHVDVLRLRSGPSTNHEILDRLRRGTVLKVTGREGEWLEVITSRSREGWVHGDYVSKPEDPEKLYEVLSVKVQPIGYAKEEVAKFVEGFTSFGCSDLVLPEFNHPNEIGDSDLIGAIRESKYEVIPKYFTGNGSYVFSLRDVQETARAIFGSDLKNIELYDDREVLGVERLSGCGQSTETRVLNIIEKEKEFHVDVVHLIYYHCPYEMDYNYLASEKSKYDDFDNEESFTDNNLALGAHITEEIIEQHIKTFPVRRYILSKEGDGILYIRQSYLVDD